MKALLVISVLFLSACSPKGMLPKFKVGDCITINRHLEKWEIAKKDISKVLEVGDRKYRLMYVSPKLLAGMEDNFNYIISVDDISVKTECPNEN